ncbi:DNA repair protein [Ruminococcus flavefaciens]|uniref:Y-family DNA polymerase n=1 Tax=Ruminococcus flavefaciens TaxID=1265 RepID=UPI00048D7705|nr:DNA repair protein [Ruminococcus flavefaciens]
MGRVYMCIDLKSFYASVECVARGYDPFEVPLVVADPTRGEGAITLAISPALKELGVKNRCRIFEIPKHIQYEIAMPRMKKYIEVSAQIYGIYLQFISPDDIHVYSIDEVFIDATPYLKTYNCSAKEFAKKLMQAVMDKTGICATAGIGTNLYLAKIAMDIVAKHVSEHIGVLNEAMYRKYLWKHQPLTDFWNVGRGTATRLAKYGVYDMEGITELPEELLYKEFGVKAVFLIDHAWGRETCTMEQIHNYKGKSRSLSNSQILFEDYDVDGAHIVMKEMVENLVLELVENNLYAKGISLFMRYSKDCIPSTGGTVKLEQTTNSIKKIQAAFDNLFMDKVKIGYGIRQIGIQLTDLTYEPDLQLSFFEDVDDAEKEQQIEVAMIGIRNRYGKNALLKGFNFLNKATGIKRNMMVGGHNG